MIKYHGTPFSGTGGEAAEALVGRHGFVSFAATQHLNIALDVCQSIALDNGAYSSWKKGREFDADGYMQWAKSLMNHPRVDWAVIPDIIDGSEIENQKLITQWFQFFHTKATHFGVPVWHMHESDVKLKYLSQAYPRIAIGSSSEFSTVGSDAWHRRMQWAMNLICDEQGQPITKIHMLRGLNPAVFSLYPFASADSTNAARNCTIDSRWKGTYTPPTSGWKARVVMARIEAVNSAAAFTPPEIEQTNLITM